MSKKIKIQINSTGGASIEADGFRGVGCKEATKPIEELFEGTGAVRKDKPELLLRDLENRNTQLR